MRRCTLFAALVAACLGVGRTEQVHGQETVSPTRSVPESAEPAKIEAGQQIRRADREEAIELLRGLLQRLENEEVAAAGQDVHPAGRDPFSTTPAMRQRALQSPAPGAAGSPAASLPPLRLVGLAAPIEGRPVALLQLGNQQTTLVREGEVLHLPSARGFVRLRIAEITADAVQIEQEGMADALWLR